jgi:hypothetical protein
MAVAEKINSSQAFIEKEINNKRHKVKLSRVKKVRTAEFTWHQMAGDAVIVILKIKYQNKAE